MKTYSNSYFEDGVRKVDFVLVAKYCNRKSKSSYTFDYDSDYMAFDDDTDEKHRWKPNYIKNLLMLLALK